ncbi:MAG: hypothetical protein Tsb0014_19230 [Pleurocapsa sp.]
MKKTIFTLIKIASTILITNALLLELWNIYLSATGNSLPNQLNPLLWLGTLALLAHLIEALIAAFNASSRQKNPLTYGIYTFFVGFVGLSELFEN